MTLRPLAFTALACLLAFPSHAANVQDAKALVARGVKHVAEVGQEQAFKDFSDPKGAFVEGELYILVYSFDGVCLAHGSDQKLIGTNRLEVTDASGKKFIAEMVAAAKARPTGFIDYMHKNAKTGQVVPKVTVFTRPEGKPFFVAAGVYRN
jgi:hypothetical protein